MSECSGCQQSSSGSTLGGRARASYIITALAFLVVALFLALPARADDPPPPCPDSDNDGYVQCSAACTKPGNKSCGDPNNGDSRIYPGAPCGVCNGPGCPIAGFCVPGSSLPCPNPAAGGNHTELTGFCMNVNSALIGVCSNNNNLNCFSSLDCGGAACNSVIPGTGSGLSVANPDGSGASCATPSNPVIFSAEGGTGLSDAQRRVAPSCGDNSDNDCDGLVDVLDDDCQSAEICDNKDNNGDGQIDEGLGVGNACSNGIGACQANGTRVCALDGTTNTVCNAVPKSPHTEGPFGSPSCTDGVDNDCDGKTDFAGSPFDDGCRRTETCDGQDEDGDGVVDNGFDVGTACSAGSGACAATGLKICKADGSGTVCGAVPVAGSIEGPSVPGSCSDGIDNDCDGAIDDNDPGCGTVGLRITCALPFQTPSFGGRAAPGKDCNSFHQIVFSEPPGVQVTAELLALNDKGTVTDSRIVHNGEFAHLASRISAEDYRFDTNTTGTGRTTHTVFAPMPMLKVTASDGVNKTTAYCTMDPWLDVVKPAGGIVSVNKSAQSTTLDSTPVIVAIPEVSPSTLVIKVDGVSIFPALGKTGAQCTVAAPCSGDVTIGGETVHIEDLVVDVAPTIDVPASNTLSMSLGGLGCGGHVVSVNGKKIPGSIPDKVTAQCLVDDLADKGTSYTFTVDITSPVTQSSNNAVPTPVTGNVCHGLPISAVSINGKEIFDPSQMTVTPNPPPPAGSDTAAKFEFPINTALGQTSLARDVVFGDAPAGTFDPGSNFVLANATDAMGNRVFNNAVVFATGDHVANPGAAISTPSAAIAGALDPQVKATLEKEFGDLIHDAVRDVSMKTGATIDVPNAFVVALDATALSNFFAEKCSGPGDDGLTLQQRFQQIANSSIVGKTFPPLDKGPFHAPSVCSCDPPFRLTVTHVDFLTNVACPVFFPGQADSYDGSVVPDNTMRVVIALPDIRTSLAGGGWCKETFLGVCIDEASVDISLQAEVTNIRLKFDITEDQIMGTTMPSDPVFRGGVSATIEPSIHVHTDVGCIGGDICEAVVTVVTLGLIDVTPQVDFDKTFDLAREIGQPDADSIKLHDIKLDEEEIANFGQKVKGDLFNVNISPFGIRASLTGKFSTDHVDPDVIANPGAFLEFPPTPEQPIASGQDGAVMVNADSINMMFASLTISGHTKGECQPSLDQDGNPRTIGSLLPADCNSINPANASAAAIARGFCHGLKQANCETLSAPGNFINTAVEQGTCHGMKGDSCSGITTGFAGIVMPADCNTLTIGGADSDDPGRATNIVQGWCAGLKALDCETLTATGGNADDTAIKQGACHGAEGHVCTTVATTAGSVGQEIGTCAAVQGLACTGLGVPGNLQCPISKIQVNLIDNLVSVAEQGACNLSPSINVNANMGVLFCARQDLPPHFVIHDNPGTDPVEVGLRLNDMSMSVVVDRNGATPGSPPNHALDGALSSTPPCFGEGSVASGDCSLAALCIDLNFLANFQIAGGECPPDANAGGLSKPGFKAAITDVQPLSRLFGQVCGGLPAGDDTKIVSESSANNASIDNLRMNAQQFSPPACMSGLTLGGFVSFQNPRIFALATGAPKSVCDNDSQTVCTSNAQCGGGSCVPIQNFIGISTKIVP